MAEKHSRGSLGKGFLKSHRAHLLLGVAALAVTDITDVMSPMITRLAIDSLEKSEGMKPLYYCALALLVAAAFQGVARFLWRKYFLGTSHTAVYELRKRMYEHLQKLPPGYYTNNKTGEIMSRLTNDLDEVRMMFGVGTLLLMDATFYFLTVPFLMFYMSPSLTMYLMIPLPLIPFIVLKIGRMYHERSERVQEKLADLSGKTQESISGIRVTRVFSLEEQELSFLGRFSNRLLQEKMSLARVDSIFDPALELCVGLAIGFFLLLGGRYVIQGEISIGAFVAFQAYLLKMVWPMMALGFAMNVCQRGLASLGRCASLLNEAPAETTEEGSETTPPAGNIEVCDLNFAYSPGSPNVLKGVSFVLPAGKTLGIAGPVGCGKSTLVQLLLRVVDPPPKSIYIDGKDILHYPVRSVRKLFGYVPQENFLFSETVRENILFGLDSFEDIELAEACAYRAGILDEIKALGSGLESMLGERGVNLSGGQKQRISIARALAVKPAILVLDDATSAVDTDTEERILDNLSDELHKRSGIIVSHRLVSLAGADLILFIDNGCVVERGNHTQLMLKNGRYAKLWRKQRMKAELEREEAP